MYLQRPLYLVAEGALTDVAAHYTLASISPSTYGSLEEHDQLNRPCVDLWFIDGLGKIAMDNAHAKPDEVVVMQMSSERTTALKRQTNILDKAAQREHSQACEASVLEEFRTWHGHDCFEMVPLKGARNVMDSVNVYKWKHVALPNGIKKWLIRCRLALRGFKDWSANDLETYAGTAQRSSQRIIASESVCRDGWLTVAIDVDKAFLQGLSYQELADLTGEEVREVHFTPPRGTEHLLKLIKGFESYDPRIHCLRCTKPGTGTKDAPRAFSLKLAKVTREQAGFQPALYDQELEFKHVNTSLVALLSKHVDDITISGEPSVVEDTITKVEHVFGKCKRSDSNFTACGIRRQQKEDGVILDQDEYIEGLVPLSHPELLGANPDQRCSDALTTHFMSLIGAVAYCLMTQHQIAVYLVALQRKLREPTIGDIRKLNIVTRKLQKEPAHIFLPRMKCSKRLELHSDSGFKKEVDRGYALRGVNFVRVGVCPNGQRGNHLLEAHCRTHKLVTRSSFGAEVIAAVNATDHGIILATTMHEMVNGPITAAVARTLRESGGFKAELHLYIDARSVYDAITAVTLKPPSERSMAAFVYWIRELLDHGILSSITWCDTRDMSADALTKGSIDRDILVKLMRGSFQFKHEVKTYTGRPRK